MASFNYRFPNTKDTSRMSHVATQPQEGTMCLPPYNPFVKGAETAEIHGQLMPQDKCLNVNGNYVDVCCISSAGHVHIKVKLKFLASECLLLYFFKTSLNYKLWQETLHSVNSFWISNLLFITVYQEDSVVYKCECYLSDSMLNWTMYNIIPTKAMICKQTVL